MKKDQLVYLRPADLLDAADLARLRAASLIELGVVAAPRGPAFVVEATRQFVRLFREDRIAAWVLVDDAAGTATGRLVGSACAVFYDRLPYPDGAEHAEIAGVYVAPEYRGEGYASELVGETVSSSRARGVRATFLKPSSDAACRLYGKLGFAEMPFMRLEETASAASFSAP